MIRTDIPVQSPIIEDGGVNPGGMPMVTLSGQLVRDKIVADLGG